MVADPHARQRRIATIALLSVCVFWGATFTWMKQGTLALRDVLPAVPAAALGVFFLLARFVLAAALMPLVMPRSVRRLDRAAWRLGFWLSLPFAAGFILQIIGLTQPDVPPSQSAFLTSLFVVATPLIGSLVHRRLPPRGVLIGVPLACIGAAYIMGPPEGGLSSGAWMTIGCAVLFGVHILVTDYATRRADPIALTFTMFVYTVGWTLLAVLAWPGGAGILSSASLAAAFTSPGFLLSVALCAVFATVIALTVLNRWQKELHPSRAAIVYTAEPVFATLISIALGMEQLKGWLFFGAGMILLANLAAEFIRRPQPLRVTHPV